MSPRPTGWRTSLAASALALLLVGQAAAEEAAPAAKPPSADVDLYGDGADDCVHVCAGCQPPTGRRACPRQTSILDRFKLITSFPQPLQALDFRFRVGLGYDLREELGEHPGQSAEEHVLALDLPGIVVRFPFTHEHQGDRNYAGDTLLGIGLPIFAGQRGGWDWHLTPGVATLLGDELGPYADDNSYVVQLGGGLARGGFSAQLFPRLRLFPVRRAVALPHGSLVAELGGDLVLGADVTLAGISGTVLAEVSAIDPLSGALSGTPALAGTFGARARVQGLLLGLSVAHRFAPGDTAEGRVLYGEGPLDRQIRLEVMFSLGIAAIDGKLDLR